jgi:hypothetical protein
MGMQTIPFAAIVLLTVAGCGGSNEVIANKKIMGQVSLMADNATDGKKVEFDGQPKAVPVIESVKKEPSTITARVTDWNTITLRGTANKGQPPKPAADKPAADKPAADKPALAGVAAGRAEFSATAVETSEFSLRNNGRQVDLKVDLSWNAAIQQGKGSIAVDVTIAGPGFCNLKGRFDLENDPKDPSNQTLHVGGYRTFKMKNGGSSDHNGVITGARCVLKAGDYTLRWSLTAQATSEGSAEINIHRAVLSLVK